MSGDRMSEVEWRVHVRRDGSYLLIDAESEDGDKLSMNIPEKLARRLLAALTAGLEV